MQGGPQCPPKLLRAGWLHPILIPLPSQSHCMIPKGWGSCRCHTQIHIHMCTCCSGWALLPHPLSLSPPPPGDRYWLFREANLEPGYPQPLVTYGQGIPYDSIDTAVWWEPTGHTFFFRGDR